MREHNLKNSASIRTYILIFSFGCVFYYLTEMLYRTHSHFTMAILGGICAVVIYRINKALYNESVIIKAFLCAVAITILEFISGIFINLIFEMKVWDYSDRMFNILGQICPLFSLFWFLISIPALYFCSYVDTHITPYISGRLLFLSQTKESINEHSKKKE